ncbi:putative holin-like toxin [Limosilactobacillus reuteri subsp. suis]
MLAFATFIIALLTFIMHRM